MRNKKNILALALAALMAASTLGYAEEAGEGGTKWGPFRAKPRLDLQYLTTDNFFNTNGRDQATGILTVNPGIALEAGTATMKYILDGDAEWGEVIRSSDDDWTDIHLSGQAIYQPTDRAKLDLNAAFQQEHDDRGTNRTEGNPNLITKPDEYDRADLGAEFTYGIADAKGQIILSLDHTNIEYTNNRAGTRERDRDEDGMGAIFKWRVAPKTRVRFEARYRDFDYDNLPVTQANTTTLDSDEERYFVGVEWDATYKTTGMFQVGRQEKNFDSATRKDTDDPTWEGSIEWRPRSYSTVYMNTGRTYGESNGTGDTSKTDYFTISWDHKWRDRFITTLGYDYAEDEYPGSATAATPKREDETDTIFVEANYEMKRWLTLGAGYEYIDKDSNNNTIEYDRNNLYVNALMRF